MIANILLHARLELQERVGFAGRYLRDNDITIARIVPYVGAFGLADIIVCGAGRFDFADDQGEPAWVMEGYGEDDETVADLVAWPVAEPRTILSMFGRIGLLGSWQAFGPEHYYFGGALPVHRTPHEWLKAGCNGAAVVTPHIAARQLIDLPGPVAARDRQHGRYLKALARSVVRDDLVLVPEMVVAA